MKRLAILAAPLLLACTGFSQDLGIISTKRNFDGAFDSIHVSTTYQWRCVDVVHCSGTDTLHIYLNADTAATQRWYCIPGTTTFIPASRIKYIYVRSATGGTVNAIVQTK
jgi:hypothetical protein